MSYAKKAVKGFVFVFFFNVIAAFIGYLYKIYMARNMSVWDYGLFFALYVFFWFLNYFRDFGLGYALAKMVPEFEAKNERHKSYAGIYTVFIVEFALSLLTVLFIFLLSNVIAAYYFKIATASNLLNLFSVVFILNLFSGLAKFILQGYQDVKSYSMIYLLENSLILLSIIALFYFEKSVYFAVLGFIIAYFVLAVISIILVFKGRGILGSKEKFSKGLLSLFLKFGIPLFLGGIASMIYLYTDTLLLSYFRTVEEVGIYSVAVSSAMVLNFIGVSLGTILLPLISEVIAKKEYEALKSGINLAYKYLMFILLPLVMILFLFSSFFITLLFGQDYSSGATALQILVLGVFFLVISAISTESLLASNNPKVVTKITLITALVNLILNLIFIPKYGIIAASVSTFVAYTLLCIMSVYYAKKALRFSLPIFAWVRMVIAGFVFIIILYVIKGYFIHFGIFGVISSVLISGIMYLFINLLLRTVTYDDFKLVMTYMLKK